MKKLSKILNKTIEKKGKTEVVQFLIEELGLPTHSHKDSDYMFEHNTNQEPEVKTTETVKKESHKTPINDSHVYYLSPHGDKGWKLMKRGGEKASFVFETKKEAMEKAREFGRENKCTIIIKKKDGKISDSIKYH